jgi:hypothetical protein
MGCVRLVAVRQRTTFRPFRAERGAAWTLSPLVCAGHAAYGENPARQQRVRGLLAFDEDYLIRGSGCDSLPP